MCCCWTSHLFQWDWRLQAASWCAFRSLFCASNLLDLMSHMNNRSLMLSAPCFSFAIRPHGHEDPPRLGLGTLGASLSTMGYQTLILLIRTTVTASRTSCKLTTTLLLKSQRVVCRRHSSRATPPSPQKRSRSSPRTLTTSQVSRHASGNICMRL